MEKSGANPDEVRIDVPTVVHGYPAPPPPPSDQDKPTTLAQYICLLFLCLPFILIFIAMCYAFSRDNFPRFQLDSVSVSFKENTTAVWHIGFSTNPPAGDLEVWARFMSRDFKAEYESTGAATGVVAGDHAMVSVSTSFPRGTSTTFQGREVTLEQVVFQCNNYKKSVNYRYVLKAACKDVTVDISSSSDEVVLKGGPRSCPIVYHSLID